MFEEAWLVEDGEPLMPLSVDNNNTRVARSPPSSRVKPRVRCESTAHARPLGCSKLIAPRAIYVDAPKTSLRGLKVKASRAYKARTHMPPAPCLLSTSGGEVRTKVLSHESYIYQGRITDSPSGSSVNT
ncbi:hypothetical protein J6590_063863 [Homalodisca vitripennis]|nr:hypothetical protein J6590_063863 [Homalodisca vitripennis]